MCLLDSWHAHTMDTVLPRIHSSNSAYEWRGEGGKGLRRRRREDKDI